MTRNRLVVAIDFNRLSACQGWCLCSACGIYGRWTDGKTLAGKHDGALIPWYRT